MATDKVDTSRLGYGWGDSVQVTEEAPTEMRPGHKAAVCGLLLLEEDDERPGMSAGTVLVLIEFGDGTDAEIPSQFVVPLEVD